LSLGVLTLTDEHRRHLSAGNAAVISAR
jgi:hypothetical protein